jgi:type IX secretion system PorP/SprF family membrane protein
LESVDSLNIKNSVLVKRLISGIFFLLPLILLSEYASGQSTFQQPVTFSQFFNYYSFLNPAATGTESKNTFKVGNQFNSGLYTRIRCFFALAEHQFQKEKKTGHGIGISFMNNKEGNLLDFNRVNVQYAVQIPLSEAWNLSSGISLGLINFHATQTGTSSDISSFALNGGLGLWLYRPKEKIGISSAQIFNNSIRVINETIPLKRFYRFIYSRTFTLSPSVKCISSVQSGINMAVRDADLNVSMLLNDLILTGVSYRFNRGSAYFVGIKDFSFMGGEVSATFAYNLLWPGVNPTNLQTVELVLSYKTLPSKK